MRFSLVDLHKQGDLELLLLKKRPIGHDLRMQSSKCRLRDRLYTKVFIQIKYKL